MSDLGSRVAEIQARLGRREGEPRWADIEFLAAEVKRLTALAQSNNCDLTEERDMLVARLAEVEQERDRADETLGISVNLIRETEERAAAAEARLAAVRTAQHEEWCRYHDTNGCHSQPSDEDA